MSLIIADTTPLSCLLRIGRTDLLGALFADVRIPTAVADELDRGAAILGDWRKVLSQIPIEFVAPSPLLTLLEGDLDAGEAAALALAVERHADLVLLDEIRGRSVARRLGLAALGTVGLIVLAKRRGLIEAARPLITRVRSDGGLWLSDTLVADTLARLGE
jgi:predicted nucleic acid-binding protein